MPFEFGAQSSIERLHGSHHVQGDLGDDPYRLGERKGLWNTASYEDRVADGLNLQGSATL